MIRSALIAAAVFVAAAVAITTNLQRDGAEPQPAEPDPKPQARAPRPTVPTPRPEQSSEPAALVLPQSRPPQPQTVPSGRAAGSLAEAEEEPAQLGGDTDAGRPHDSAEEYSTSYLRVYSKFKEEPRDPTASVQMEAALLNRIAQQPGLTLTSLEVECRTSICRVRLVGPEVLDESRNIDFGGFGTVVGSTDPGADGSLITEVLLARDPAAAQ
jgi:hypothetical protein